MTTRLRLRRVCFAAALAVVLGLVASGPLWAQTASASISGTVKDAQGAVLPGVTVTLTSTTKGTDTVIISDGLGNFLFPYVQPDTYTVKVALEGFQGIQQPNLKVDPGARLTVGPYTLQVGSMQESITVTAQSESIQLRSGERAFTLESGAIQNIAVNGRSFFGLAMLVPGVISTSGETPSQVSGFSVNGQRTNSNNMTIDGVANIDTGDNGGNMAQTNLDAVAEFRVLTAAYQAEYGRAMGGQVQVVTKSGSRNFSGSAYWYARRSEWNENTFFNKRTNTPMAKSSRDDRGFTLGGPLYVPGLFNEEKNKLFFFFSQEYQRRKDPVNETRVTVPTALERKGDFSQSVDANGNPYPYIKDYTTGLPCSASNTSGCFQDGGVLGRIPASRLYAPTLAALNVYPQPNTTGVGYNYRSQTVGKNPLDQTMIRMDYQVNNNWRLTGRYMFHKNKAELPYGIGGWSLGGNIDTAQVISDVPGRNAMISTTGILSNTTSIELSFGQGHNSLDHYSESPLLTRAGSGTAGIPLLYPNAVQLDFIPQFTFGGGRIGNAPNIRTHQAPFTNFNTTYDAVANLTKVMGAHSAKVGLYFQRSLKDQSAFAAHNGAYSFANSGNNPYDSQHPFANAALGIYDSFSQASEFLKPKWRYSNVEAYLQDNWRASDKLTLDYGIRFYYLTPQWDASEKASNFYLDDFNKSAAVRLFQPAIVNGARVGYDAKTGQTVASNFIGRIVPGSGDRFQGTAQGGTLTDGNKIRVSPRLGFAYDITGKQSLVFRGAFGIFYDRPQGNQVFDLITNPPGMQVTSLQWGLASQIAGATGLFGPVGLNPNVYKWETPMVYQWNVGVQKLLPHGFYIDISHVGSETRNVLQKRQVNALPYGTAYQAASQDPTRGQACTGCSGLSTLPGGNALPTDLLRPYQGYTNINLWEFSGYQNYRALQASLSRRFSKGMMFGLHYTLSSAKGISGGDWDGARIDGKDREANYGPLGYDRTHVVAASFVYQVPKLVEGAAGFLVNDWQLSGNFRYNSGTPYGIGYSISGVGSINLTGSDQGARIVITGDTGSGNSSDIFKQFNTSAFKAPSAGSNGLESPRVYMRTNSYRTLDLSLSKSFPLYKKARVEVRVDAFNALNTNNWSGRNTTANFASMGSTEVLNIANSTTNMLGFGAVTSTSNPRQMQAMARFSF